MAYGTRRGQKHDRVIKLGALARPHGVFYREFGIQNEGQATEAMALRYV